MTKDSFDVYELDFSSFVLLPRAANGKPEMTKEEPKGQHRRSVTEGNPGSYARPSLARSQSAVQSDLKATAKEFVPSTPTSTNTKTRSRANSEETFFPSHSNDTFKSPLLRSQSFGGFDAFSRSDFDHDLGRRQWSSSPCPVPANTPASVLTGSAVTIPTPSQRFNFNVAVPEEDESGEETTPAYDKATQRRLWDEEMCAQALRESLEFEEQLVDQDQLQEQDQSEACSTCDFSKLSLNLSPEILESSHARPAPSTAPQRQKLSPSNGQREAEARMNSQSNTAQQQRAQQRQQVNPAAQYNKHRKSLSLYTISEGIGAAAADKAVDTPSMRHSFPKAPPPTPQVTPSSQTTPQPQLSPAIAAALLANPSLLLPMDPAVGMMSPLQLAHLQMATMTMNFPLPMPTMSPMSQAGPMAPMPSPAMIQTLQNHARSKSFDQWKADLSTLMGGPMTPTVQKTVAPQNASCRVGGSPVHAF